MKSLYSDIHPFIILALLIMVSITAPSEKRLRKDINPSKWDIRIVKYRTHVAAIMLMIYSYRDGFNYITLISCLYIPYLLIKSDNHIENTLSKNKNKSDDLI